ncbi:MAG: outer membrane protein assembly factor BamD [Candidatus Solibacter sp.]|nr:outer membrane protein assembly factor BamD [Candidatus Solibacter sp.]
MVRNAIRSTAVVLAVAVLLGGCGIRRKKYNNPITKDTQQPDKVLFDKAINDIEHSRFEIARLLLQNLINTYDTSEYLAKAKLAIADAWFREGGSHGLAQAEAEYKDFILFYPAMEEASEAQEKVCDIHYKQMEKPDRDPMHALRAEQECKQLILQFPNSKFAPLAQQKLRDIQEVLADSEFRVGTLYQKKGSFPAAANRFQAMVDQFPIYSKADEALWQMAESYHRMGDRFENQQVTAYQRIVKDYPLSIHAEDARAQLEVMKRTVPEADTVAMARMKYELENRTNASMISHFWGLFRSRPDMRAAAKSGTPPMEGFRPRIPESVPPAAANPGALGTNEVSISNPGSDSEIDKGKEVRANVPGAEAAPATPATPAAPAATENAAKAPDPNDTAKQASMTPAQQKKEYQKQLKQQQDAVKKAQSDRKKKEAQQLQAVKDQKKKSRAKQDEQKQEQKQPQPPAPAGAQAPTPPAKQ